VWALALGTTIAAGLAVSGNGGRAAVGGNTGRGDVDPARRAPGMWLELVGELQGGPGSISAVAVQDQRAYVGMGGKLVGVDVADPAEPRILGASETLDAPWIHAVAVSGDTAFVAGDSGGLFVLDVANPSRPRATGRYVVPGGRVRGVVAAQGDVVVLASEIGRVGDVAAETAGLHVLHVGDGGQPAPVGFVGGIGDPRSVSVASDTAYVVSGFPDRSHRLFTVDLSQRAAPRVVAAIEVPAAAFDVAVSDRVGADGMQRTAYIANGDGLVVVDVTESLKPGRKAAIATLGTSRAVAVADPYVYVADWEFGGLTVFDASDPSRPSRAGFHELGWLSDIAVAGGLVYAADWWSLRLIDASVPEHPREVGVYRRPDTWDRVALENDRAYLISRTELRIVDAADRARPREIGLFDLRAEVADMAVRSRSAYVLDATNRFRVIDASPHGPREIWSTSLAGPARGLALAGGYAFFVVDGGGTGPAALAVYDIADPAHPRPVGRPEDVLRVPPAVDMIVHDKHLVMVGRDGALRVVDVDDPGRPRLAGTLPGLGDTVALGADHDAAGTMAALDRQGRLHVLDVRDPTRPARRGTYAPAEIIRPWALAVTGGHAFLATSGGIEVIDIAQPDRPFLAADYATDDEARDVVAAAGELYVVERQAGLLVLAPRWPTSGRVWLPFMGRGVGGSDDRRGH